MKLASVGSISSGTLRTEDLLDALASELEYHINRNAAEWTTNEGRAERDRLLALVKEAQEADPDSEDASYVIQELEDELGEFAPPYCYFGTHEGAGADFGFWPIMDQIDELPDVPKNEEESFADAARRLGEDCKHVNDHGNVTVYGGDGSIILELV